MMHRLASWLIALLATLSVHAVEVRQFDDLAKQARYERLIEELRCLVCQNQSLADSDADLARDLRDEVYGIIQSGKDEQEAIHFLTDRYGDFVLYRPPVKPITWLLWIGPLLILLGGGLFLWRRHAHSRLAINEGLTATEHQRLEQLKHDLLHKDDP